MNSNSAKVVGYTYDAWGNYSVAASTTDYAVAHSIPSDTVVITSTKKQVGISSTHVTTLPNGEDSFPLTTLHTLIPKM